MVAGGRPGKGGRKMSGCGTVSGPAEGISECVTCELWYLGWPAEGACESVVFELAGGGR